MATVPDKIPARFELKDSVVELCTWSYIVFKLEEILTPVIASIESTNSSLLVIEQKLDTWLENTDD